MPPELLNHDQIKDYLKEIPGWDYSKENKKISRQFSFKNYYETLAFINATAWVTHQENHHPYITFGYNACSIYFTTHSAAGVTLYDFICAAKIDQL
ncbi:MAG: 4a-hydroxytetrahydrobiopterin dehydratase [Gammaproteobacteria bacterium]|nr:4a-hydroxytetrahydrobiopterin dehydratase [Gammaproteobacteria bacterium]